MLRQRYIVLKLGHLLSELLVCC